VTADYKKSTSQRPVNRGEKVSIDTFEVPIIVAAVKEELILLISCDYFNSCIKATELERNRKKSCKCIPS